MKISKEQEEKLVLIIQAVIVAAALFLSIKNSIKETLSPKKSKQK